MIEMTTKSTLCAHYNQYHESQGQISRTNKSWQKNWWRFYSGFPHLQKERVWGLPKET